MTCVHGMDARFCSICNRRAAGAAAGGVASDASLEEIVTFLNEQQVRASYGAVAEALHVIPRSMSARLGPGRPEASWAVSAETGLPTDYGPDESHPSLLQKAEVISKGRELLMRMSIWRARRREGSA